MNTLRPRVQQKSNITRPNRVKRCPGGQIVPMNQSCPRPRPSSPRKTGTRAQQFKDRYAR